MEEDFRALLLAASPVTAICGTRINFGTHPQGQSFPALVLNTVSDAEGLVMNGPNNLSEGIVQVDCYAETYGAAKLLARSVVAALNCYRGGDFRLIVHGASRDTREGGTNEAERLFRVSLDFNTSWRAI